MKMKGIERQADANRQQGTLAHTMGGGIFM